MVWARCLGKYFLLEIVAIDAIVIDAIRFFEMSQMLLC